MSEPPNIDNKHFIVEPLLSPASEAESSSSSSSKKLITRVCVLSSSYLDCTTTLGSVDAFVCNPAVFFAADEPYTFDYIELRKATVYRDIRALVKSKKYDVFFNLCDGARDEERAGEEVIRALEEFHVPVTGASLKYFELSKPDMKMIAHYSKIPTAKYAVIEEAEMDYEGAISQLDYPVIVKHVSGYGSIGMTKDCKCASKEQLLNRVERFVQSYQGALVEEFVLGDEVTVLACADSSLPGGVRVYHPVMMKFPEGEDFKHFDLKWQAYDSVGWIPVPQDDPALPQILDIGRKAFKEMMGGIGYGRCDLRVNRQKNEVVFLEINPNCGIMYPPGSEGSADYILKFSDQQRGHRDFTVLQIEEAIARAQREAPKFRRCFDSIREFHLRASRPILAGEVIFADEGRPFRIITKAHVGKHWTQEQQEQFANCAWPLGSDKHFYALWDVDPAQWRSVNHSCDPNLVFDEGRSLNVVALRDIRAGEELTMDYRTFTSDESANPSNVVEQHHCLKCHCDAKKCSGMVMCGDYIRTLRMFIE